MSHAHEHEHKGEHEHEHDFAAANVKHFDSEAKAFDTKPSVIELARRVTKAMVERYPSLFDEEKTSVLDFACGTGTFAASICVNRILCAHDRVDRG